MKEKILELLEKKDELTILDIKKIVREDKTKKEVQLLLDILTVIRMDVTARFRILQDFILIESKKISGIMIILETEEKYLDKLIIKLKTPKINKIEDLKSAISIIDTDFRISYVGENCSYNYKTKEGEFAIASLIKVVVIAICYYAIDKKIIDFEYKYVIKESDISILSQGINKSNIGEQISIKELLINMVQKSDNTAMDIIIEILGETLINEASKSIFNKKIKIEKTKKIYYNAWGIGTNTEKELRTNSTYRVMWDKGYDYFLDFDDLIIASEYISQFSEIPWDFINTLPEQLAYKGGSGPGVYSGLWFSRRNKNKKILIFAMNRKEIYTLMEELYVVQNITNFLNMKEENAK